MTSHIFISYARIDGTQTAKWLADELRGRGFEVWSDHDLHSHMDFSSEIEKAIRQASHVIVCGSADVERDDSFVRREILFAQKYKKPIIPLMLLNGYLPITIISNTYIDFANYQAGLEKLLVQLGLGSAPTPMKPPPPIDSLEGDYRITGTNPADQSVYQGTMSIRRDGSLYEIDWNAGVPLRGYGLRLGDVLAAVYLGSFSLSAYRIEADGKLVGRFVDRSINAMGSEECIPRGTLQGLVGEYDVTTTADSGSEHQASLKIQPYGRRKGGLGGLFGNLVPVPGVVLLTWKWEGIAQQIQAVGFVVGQTLITGYPDEPDGLVGYQIRPDGQLIGTWFGAGQEKLGSEKAERA